MLDAAKDSSKSDLEGTWRLAFPFPGVLLALVSRRLGSPPGNSGRPLMNLVIARALASLAERTATA